MKKTLKKLKTGKKAGLDDVTTKQLKSVRCPRTEEKSRQAVWFQKIQHECGSNFCGYTTG